MEAQGPLEPTAPERLIQPAFLMAVVFSTGWIMMGLEILGGRMLQPEFGSEIYVWGSIIGVFLLSLSVGYFLGGKLSLRVVSPRTLAAIIGASGLLVFLIPLVRRPVVDFFSMGVDDGAWGSLLAAVALFFIPTILLGMVSPYAVRLSAESIASVGDRAGQLYAVSTIGSFFGTIFTSFYLIGWMHVPTSLRTKGLVLIGLALLVEVVSRIRRSQ